MPYVNQFEEFDVVIVGHGISGLSTALSVHETGATPVILEKSPEEKAGGHSRYAGGVFRFPHQNPEEVKEALDLERNPPQYTKEDFWGDLMDVTNGRTDRALSQILVEESYDAIKWIHSHGVEFSVETKVSGEEETGYEASAGGRQAVGEGEGAINALKSTAEELGITRHYDTEMRELILDEKNQVRGVEASNPDGTVKYEADSVVICAGSYVSDPEKRTRYYGKDGEGFVVRGSRYNTGEAIEAALDVGAAAGGEWGGAHQVLLDDRAPKVEGGRTRINGYQYSILLNENGERYVDEGEDVLVKTYAKMGKELYEQPNQSAFVIFDSKIEEYVMSQMHKDPIEATSMEGLLDKVDIKNPEKAMSTIEEFNNAVDRSIEFDPESLDGKSAQGISPPRTNWAVPIEEPPFYAFPVSAGITFAFGGLRINTDSQVLNTQERAIEGLWAVGNSTSEFFYGNYPAGSALARGATFGRRAGQDAAEYALEGGN